MHHCLNTSPLLLVAWCMGASLSLGCAALQDPKTYDDAANIACELLAQEKAKEAELQGVSFEDVHKAVKQACDAKEKVQPWIDALLAASREQDATMGKAMGVPAEKQEK